MATDKNGKGKKNDRFDELIHSLNKKFGKDSGTVGSLQQGLDVIPTGITSLDFALGVGGWARRHMHGVYGPRDVGKSSVVGLGSLREAQKLGLGTAIIAVEPGFDPVWAAKHGVDTDNLIVARPDDGEEAFDMAFELVESGVVQHILFDSIGALLANSEAAEGGKMKQGGQAGLITWGMKRLAPRVWKRNVCMLFMNQIRDDMNSRVKGMYQQPGGHALEHLETSIVRLRRGKDKYTLKVAGDDVEIGTQIVAVVERNKLTEGSKQKAVFDFFSKETDDYPFGVDFSADLINTAKRMGVIKQAGAYYTLPGMKKNSIKSFDKVTEHIEKHPEMVELIRKEVFEIMYTGNAKTPLEAVDE